MEKLQKLSFEHLYQLYAERILNMAFRMTGSEEVARDLTQDVFIKVYQRYSTFRGESGIYTWIYRIAVNHILSYLKRAQRQKWLNLLDRNISDLIHNRRIDASSWGTSLPITPDRAMEKSQREEIVWRTIQRLPPKQSVPLILFRYEGLSYREIAEAMGISLSAVESRIHRARAALIKHLEPWLDKI